MRQGQEYQQDADQPRDEIDVENHAPVHVFGEIAAQQRTDDQAARPPKGKEADGQPALRRRKGLGHKEQRHRQHRAAAHPLQNTEGDQDGAVPRQAAQHGTNDKQRDADQQEIAIPQHVAQPSHGGNDNGTGNHVSGNNPLHLVEAHAQRGHDGGQRHAGGRYVQQNGKDVQHHGAGNPPLVGRAFRVDAGP